MSEIFAIGIQVKSSSLDVIAYDTGSRTFAVRFKNQEEYLYRNVPETIWEQLLKADSLGSYFSLNIRRRTDQFSWKRINVQFTKIISLQEYLCSPTAEPLKADPEEMKAMSSAAWW